MKSNPEMMRALIDKASATGLFFFNENQIYIGLYTPRFRENNEWKILSMASFLQALYGDEEIDGKPAYIHHGLAALETELRGDNAVAYHFYKVIGKDAS